MDPDEPPPMTVGAPRPADALTPPPQQPGVNTNIAATAAVHEKLLGVEEERREHKHLATVVRGSGVAFTLIGTPGLLLCAFVAPWWANWVLLLGTLSAVNCHKRFYLQAYHMIMQIIWGTWCSVLALPVAAAVQWPRVRTHPVRAVYLALAFGPVGMMLTIGSIVVRCKPEVPWFGGKTFLRVFWDPPLLMASYVCDQWLQPLFNGGPFFDDGKNPPSMISIVGPTLCMGGRPLAKHVPDLLRHSVHTVVNMTAEWPGPTAEYEAAGIKQHRIRVVDTTAPTFEELCAGVEFVRRRLEEREGRVYIHCKGGRARASAMMLCCMMALEGLTLRDAYTKLKQVRPAIEASVQAYDGVKAFDEMCRSRGRSQERQGGLASDAGLGGGRNHLGTNEERTRLISRSPCAQDDGYGGVGAG